MAGGDGLSAAVLLTVIIPSCRVPILTAFGQGDTRGEVARQPYLSHCGQEARVRNRMEAARPAEPKR